jgi:hypothetical protein
MRMALPPRDHRISLEAAAGFTRRYRQGAGENAQKAGAFHADQVQQLLAQPGCDALRIYYAIDDKGQETFVLVGVDGNDKDMTGGTLLEFGFPCPPFCDDGSGLNG